MTFVSGGERGIDHAPILTFRGVRGSMPVSGPPTQRYGGHTLSIDVQTGQDLALIIDGGTGIASLEPAAATVSDYHILLTHYHWDHIQGLLFFPSLYDSTKTFTFYGHDWEDQTVADCLNGALRPPWFPISFADTAATKLYAEPSEASHTVPGLVISNAQLHHPQGVTAYRIDGPNRAVVIATDYESGDPRADAAVRELAAGADVLVHDAQYTPEEYRSDYQGWGHSTWAHAADAANDAGVDELILISHAPSRTDDEIDTIVQNAQCRFENTRAAYEGLQLSL